MSSSASYRPTTFQLGCTHLPGLPRGLVDQSHTVRGSLTCETRPSWPAKWIRKRFGPDAVAGGSSGTTLRAFFFYSDKDGKDKETLAQCKRVHSTKQSAIVRSPVSVGRSTSDISAILEAPATYIRNLKLHLNIICPSCRSSLLLIGLRG